jgi:hypothetical protein
MEEILGFRGVIVDLMVRIITHRVADSPLAGLGSLTMAATKPVQSHQKYVR